VQIIVGFECHNAVGHLHKYGEFGIHLQLKRTENDHNKQLTSLGIFV
jgi:hypothetical protein